MTWHLTRNHRPVERHLNTCSSPATSKHATIKATEMVAIAEAAFCMSPDKKEGILEEVTQGSVTRIEAEEGFKAGIISKSRDHFEKQGSFRKAGIISKSRDHSTNQALLHKPGTVS